MYYRYWSKTIFSRRCDDFDLTTTKYLSRKHDINNNTKTMRVFGMYSDVEWGELSYVVLI